MRPVMLILSAALLAGCALDSPYPAFAKGQTWHVKDGNSTFHIRRVGDVVEIIRTGWEYPARIGDIFPRAAVAVEQVTGCDIRRKSMKGDGAVMWAKLDCD